MFLRPADSPICRRARRTPCAHSATARAAVIEKPYEPQSGAAAPQIVVGNESSVANRRVDGRSMPCAFARSCPTDRAYDFAVNTMTYDPGAALSMVEIHVMEHGLLMLEGGGIYRLGDSWYPVEAGDFIWMAPTARSGLARSASGRRNTSSTKIGAGIRWEREADGTSRTLATLTQIDGLIAELTALAQISEAEPPVVTRVVFSEADLRARAYVKGLCAEAGLAVHEDAIGNTFARWQGSEPDLAPVGTGSHIDAIPNAGLYDGCVGVLGGLEAIRVLQQLGFKPRRSIELVIFTAEEPTRFGIGCLGSRMMAGVLTPQQALALRDKEGRGLEELRTQAGFTGSLESVALPAGRFHQFVELHIEQGPLLEQEGIDVGLVTHIAAPASMRILIEGEGGHAGGKLMPGRKDALAAAAELILALEAAAKSTGAIDTVATVGCLRGLSRRGQQHSLARAAGDRYSRHRCCAPRPRARCSEGDMRRSCRAVAGSRSARSW